MRYLSVCSGIEAASVAWEGLGWTPLAFSEIEAFPRAVLQHHYPDVPLHGDFTELRKEPWIKDADVLVGGTPCQAFSIAGLRNSLDDERGNLTLEFVRLANAIDAARPIPSIIVWENVPGVLSVKDNAFGCFLAALVGDDTPIVPPRGKWSNAGLVAGPKRRAAWRVLDAQYFGLAQRRRRVFVVASARDDFDPAEVLFEREGVQRHTAPRREAGKTAPTIPSRSSAGGGLGDTESVAHSLRAGGIGQADYEMESFVVGAVEGFAASGVGYWRDGVGPLRAREQDSHENLVTHSLRAGGFDASEDGTGRGTPLVPVEVAGPLSANGGTGKKHGYGMGQQDWESGYAVPISFSAKDYRADAADDLSPTLRSGGHTDSHANGGVMPAVAYVFHPTQDPIPQAADISHAMSAGSSGGQASIAVAYDMRGREGGSQFEGPHETANIRAANGGSSRSYVAFAQNTRDEVRYQGGDGNISGALSADPGTKQQTYVAHAIQAGALRENPASGPDGVGVQADVAYTIEARAEVQAVQTNWAVRRLTPRECERLQGFPDDYTLISVRGKPAADGPRYKALGNSMAVPVMRWIGSRIAMEMK